jgi:tripartite-type tricarboxylate transporter receptor subunit TctC
MLAAAGSEGAHAQAWPSRTVKLITPQPAGTAIDTGLRMFADRLSKRWGRSVIVENRPGGDGIPATSSFVMARDDHALYGSPGYPFTIAPWMFEKLPYDPRGDVSPISLVFDAPLMIAATAKFEANSLSDLEKLAKAQPGKLNWASTAGLPNFAFSYFLKTTGSVMAYVPYRDAASALNDVGEGRVQVYATSYGTVLPVLQSGKIKVLAMLGAERIALAPNIPTSTEAGYPKVRADGFAGLFGARGMSSALRERIAADVKAIAGDDEVRAVMAKSAMVPRGLSPAEFQKVLDDQSRQVREMIGVLGIARKAPQ